MVEKDARYTFVELIKLLRELKESGFNPVEVLTSYPYFSSLSKRTQDFIIKSVNLSENIASQYIPIKSFVDDVENGNLDGLLEYLRNYESSSSLDTKWIVKQIYKSLQRAKTVKEKVALFGLLYKIVKENEEQFSDVSKLSDDELDREIIQLSRSIESIIKASKRKTIYVAIREGKQAEADETIDLSSIQKAIDVSQEQGEN